MRCVTCREKNQNRQILKAAVESLESRRLLIGSVVINEIHYNPDINSESVEFVELYNPGDTTVDLSGAAFTSGITYTFPSGTTLPAGGYKVIGQNVSAVQTKFGITGVLGPFSGKLSNEGETLTLRNASNIVLDSVDYQPGFPWPTVGDAPGRSIELINPNLDNSIGGNWRSGIPASSTQLFASNGSWRYRKGTTEASSPTSVWRNLSFTEDGTWLTGNGPIGYDPSLAMGTNLLDMSGNYSSVFLRKTFTVANPSLFTGLRLEAFYDDGFNVWINGTLAKSQNVSSTNLAYNALASVSRESGNYDSFNLSNLLIAGSNVIAVQFHNLSLSGSTDAFFDARLFGTNGGSGGPTPGSQNANFASNAAPAMRQLTVSPQQPTAGQAVTITMHVTDTDNVGSVNLEYQTVNPGSYIRLTDAAYTTSWLSLPMHDDGVNGDVLALDGIYSVVVPASVQTNRRLVRYRVTAIDSLGASVVAPYADDPTPNFAYFVYNGVPGWTGASNPGITTATNFPTSITANGPAVYHVIANATDINNSQYVSTYDGVDFRGTIVYDGVVYDHITFSNRGEYSTYVSGKNKWKVSFNSGHEFQARDNYGRPYSQKWGKMNLNANASPWMPVNRGMAGLDEALSFRMYQLAGVLASNTNYVHLRVIDDSQEAPLNQYNGDLWGLYLAVENNGSKFTDEHNVPDGNTYSISAGAGELKNEGEGQPSDGSDWTTFKASASVTSTTEAWWNANLNLDSFYSFTAINRISSNVDLRPGDNYNMYHNPDGHWEVLPWDLDMMYAPETHQVGYTYMSNALVHTNIMTAYRNRAREILDLMFSNSSITGGQIGQLVNEYARFINTPNGSGGWNMGWAEIDQYMWNYNPRTTVNHTGVFYVTPKTDTRNGGTWTRTLSTADFAGQMKYVTDFMTDTDPNSWAIGDGDQRGYGYNYLESEAADTAIPNTPTTSYIGGASFPINNLKFSTSAYSDPNGTAFSAMEWRIAEISNPNTPNFDFAQPWKYEITPTWESGEITTFNSQVTIPSSSVQAGHTYRLRVRYKDATGRWSHWSDASAAAQSEFTVTAVSSPLPDNVRVTELNYNPAAYSGVTDTQDLEFIELTNFGSETVDLAGAYFSVGITFTFPSGASLAPGQSGVVVRGQTNFQTRYGTAPLILGTYGASGTNFSNGGEIVTIMDTLGSTVSSFTYVDSWYPTTDGGGHTLEVIDPASNPNLNLPTSWRASLQTGGSPGIFDVTAPSVISETYDNTNSPAKLSFNFNENVSASIGLSDIQIINLTTSINHNPISFSFVGNTVVFNFAAGALPDGNYRATLLAPGITDAAGNVLAANYVYEFFQLAGDANQDRYVNSADQAILSANLNLPGNFTQGDFDYNGTVNSADQLILTSHLDVYLPPQGIYTIPNLGSNEDHVILTKENATYFNVSFTSLPSTLMYRIPFGAVTAVVFNGGAGDDKLTLDYTNGTPFSGSSLTFDGGDDSDTLAIIGSASADTVTFNASNVAFGSTTIAHSNIESRTFDGKLGLDNLTVSGGPSVKMSVNQQLNALNITAGSAEMLAGTSTVLSVKSITLGASAKLDLHDNDMLVDYTGSTTPIVDIISKMKSGLTLLGGNGFGIGSSEVDSQTLGGTVLAVQDNAEVNGEFTELSGVLAPTTSILIKYTWFGDANLSGIVDGGDYALVDTGFTSSSSLNSWLFGNFNFDAFVTGDDYALIDTGFIAQDRVL